MAGSIRTKPTASPERKSYEMRVPWIGSANILVVAAIIVAWSGWAGAGATELPGHSSESGPVAPVWCALYQLNREYEPAVRACTEALRSGEDAEVYSNRGSAFLKLNELDRAIADFDRAIQLEPGNAIRYYNRGTAFSWKHEGEKAIEEYSEAIRLRPDLAPAYANRAREFELLGERDRAITDYRTALQLAPELETVIEDDLRRLRAP
jgi:tetratricopeptide (TPR) repeat protein